MIHVIGDSHTSVFGRTDEVLRQAIWKSLGPFRIMHLGPITAYNVKEKQAAHDAARQVPDGDPVLFSFGEIDCRCMVGRAEDPEENINTITQRYFDFILSQPNRNVILMNPTPCLVEEPFKDWFAQPENKDIWFSTRGTLEERNSYKMKFAEACRDFCSANGFKYIDCWDVVFGKREMYMDDIHLSPVSAGPTIRELLK